MRKILFMDDSFWVRNENIITLFQQEKLKGYAIYEFLVKYLKHRPTGDASMDALPSLSINLGTKNKYLVHIINDFGLFNIKDGKFSLRSCSDEIYPIDEKLLSQGVLSQEVPLQEVSSQEMFLPINKIPSDNEVSIINIDETLQHKHQLQHQLQQECKQDPQQDLQQNKQWVLCDELNPDIHNDIDNDVHNVIDNAMHNDIDNDIHNVIDNDIHNDMQIELKGPTGACSRTFDNDIKTHSSRAYARTRTHSSSSSSSNIKKKKRKKEKQALANDNILPVENLPESLLVVKSESTKQLSEKQQNVGLDQTNDGGQTNNLARPNDLDQSSKLQQVADSPLSSDLIAKDQPVNIQPEIKQSKKLCAAASSPKSVTGGSESLPLSNREDLRVRQHVQLLRQDSTLATDAFQEVHHSRARPESSASEPSTAEVSASELSTAGPSTHELVATEPLASEPSVQELVEPKPSNQQLVAAKISTQKATASKSSAQQLGGSKVATQLHVVPDDPVRTVYSFDELVEKMLQSSCYMEVVAMHSRLGEKFTQHLNLIVKLFKNHVYLRGKLEKMTSLGEVQSYFSNFLIPGSSNSKAVIKAIFDAERENTFKHSAARQMDSTAPPAGNVADRASFAARQIHSAARQMGNQSVGNQTLDSRQMGNQSVGNQMLDSQLIDNQSMDGQRMDGQPMGGHPMGDRLPNNQSVDNLSSGNQFFDGQTVENRSVGNQAVTDRSFSGQSIEELEAEIFGSYDVPPHMEGNLYQFEYVEDGKRMYCGREIPPEAPPRPSRYAVWNLVTKKWGR